METHYDAPEDDPFRGAMLEICELEVYGKLMVSYTLQDKQLYYLKITKYLSAFIKNGIMLV